MNEAARLRAIVESAGVAILCTDEDFRITEFNPGAERAFGRPRAEVIGMRYSSLLPEMVRDKVDRDCARVFDGEAIEQFENTIVDVDGHVSVLLWDVRCLRNADGEAVGLVAVGQDITARQIERGMPTELSS